jgi:hypothetical protein
MKKSLTSFLKKFGLPLLVFLTIFALSQTAFAAGEINAGINQVDNNIILGDVSPMNIVVRIINILLGFLGFTAVCIFIYAGFVWMTSAGSEEKINQAKQLLKNAVIGILIILSAWGIVTYIFSKLLGITGNGGAINSATDGSNFKNLSLGALGACSVESVYPTPESKEVSRNAAILVSAKEPFQLDTICIDKNKNACACDNTANCNLINPQNIQIYKTADGNSCLTDCKANLQSVEVSVATGAKTLILRPVGYLGNSSGNVEYAIRLTGDIKKFGGESLFKSCSSEFLEWKFETNSKLDLEAPQIIFGGIFPPVDSEADVTGLISAAKVAEAKIIVNNCPKTYTSATTTSVTKVGASVDAEVVVNQNYNGVVTNFRLDVSGTKLLLFSGNSSLGSSEISNNQAVFDSFTVKLASVVSGNSWNFTVKPAQAADNLTIGNTSYIFVNKPASSGILVPSNCNTENMAESIVVTLSGNNEVNVSSSGGNITLKAKAAGVSGNSLNLLSNSDNLTLTKFTGGTEQNTSYQIKGLKDKPMNSIIQVNFNEAMNPMVLAGTADEVQSFVRLVNNNSFAKNSGESCGKNSDCLSYDCQATKCVGNYVSGKYSLSNAYKTLEFISNKECGVNSCGETMYCLPANSHLSFRINAAKLKACSVNTDCQIFAPYASCVNNVCRDINGQANYPLADSLNPQGAVDLAFNSLDGNRDKKVDGPVAPYPYFIEGDSDLTKRDGFEFSFWVSSQINSEPPTISLTSPKLEDSVSINSPVKIEFNQLMMNSTLKTGSLTTGSGMASTTEHKLINLRSSVSKPLGYWLESENLEKGTADGEPDFTVTRVLHSDFFESITYISQIGSGVKNIYQNCFKPSVGFDCIGFSDENPSCCFDKTTNKITGTNILDSNGNCIN